MKDPEVECRVLNQEGGRLTPDCCSTWQGVIRVRPVHKPVVSARHATNRLEMRKDFLRIQLHKACRPRKELRGTRLTIKR